MFMNKDQNLINEFAIKTLKENLNVMYAQIWREGQLTAEYKRMPVKTRLNTWSACKGVVSCAVGIALDEGLIQLDEKIVDIFPEYVPEKTEGYEGFFHLMALNGNPEEASMSYIIRDHDRTKFENRKKEMERLVVQMNAEYGAGTVTLELRDQYYNMREKIEPVMHIIDTAFAAMEAVGVKPNVKPIRGGTDGAQLSFKGLPCPNIFAGGLNFHGRYEFVPIQNMEKAMKVIVKIAELVASK